MCSYMNELSSYAMSSSESTALQTSADVSSHEKRFRRHFPFASSSERIAEACVCGLRVSKVLRMGRMLISPLHLYFYSTFMASDLVLPWSNVTSLFRKKTSFYNAIYVEVKDRDPYVFAGFLRNSVTVIFNLLYSLHKSHEIRNRPRPCAIKEKKDNTQCSENTYELDLSGDCSDNSLSSLPPLLSNIPMPSPSQSISNSPGNVSPMSPCKEGEGYYKGGSMHVNVNALMHENSCGIPHDCVSLHNTSRAHSAGSRCSSSTCKDGVPHSPSDDKMHQSCRSNSLSKAGQVPRSQATLHDMPLTLLPTMTRSSAESNPSIGCKINNVVDMQPAYLPNSAPTSIDSSLSSGFSCTYMITNQCDGKLFLAKEYVLFVSPFLKNSLQIPYEEIKTAIKAKMMMILDCIVLTTRTEQNQIFTNFVSCDVVLKHIKRTRVTSKSTNDSECLNQDEESVRGASVLPNAVSPIQTTTMACAQDLSAIPVAASFNEFSKVETDYGSAFSPFEHFTNEVLHPVYFKKGKTLLDVFALAYDDNAVLAEKYHTLLGDTEQRSENWRPTNDGAPYRGQRLYQCTTVVKAMMGKLRPYDEYQRYAFLRVGDIPTLIVQSSSHVSGVMFSDSFRPQVLTVFTQTGVGDNAVVAMRGYGYVHFMKSVWIKGKITATAMSEIQDGSKRMAELIGKALKVCTSNTAELPVLSSKPSMVRDAACMDATTGLLQSNFSTDSDANSVQQNCSASVLQKKENTSKRKCVFTFFISFLSFVSSLAVSYTSLVLLTLTIMLGLQLAYSLYISILPSPGSNSPFNFSVSSGVQESNPLIVMCTCLVSVLISIGLFCTSQYIIALYKNISSS